jgi:hypothetical protein
MSRGRRILLIGHSFSLVLNELRGVIFRWNGTRGLPFATISYSRRSWRLTVFDEGGE